MAFRRVKTPAVDWHVHIGCLHVRYLGDLVASLKTQPDDITPKQFNILFGIAAGTMFQMVLAALILVPVAIRFAPRTSFRKALITLEGCAFISIVFWAIGVLVNMHQYAHWAK